MNLVVDANVGISVLVAIPTTRVRTPTWEHL